MVKVHELEAAAGKSSGGQFSSGEPRTPLYKW